MARTSLWLAPCSLGALLFLTGALGQPAPDPANAVTDAGPLPPGRDARRLLDQAVDAFHPNRVPWQRCDVWQRLAADDGVYEIQGRYLCAPGARLRLDLETQAGRVKAQVQLIGDGQRLWQRQRVGGDAPAVTQVELPVPPKDLSDRAGFEAWRTQVLHEQSFGVSALLRLLRDGSKDWTGKRVRWREGEVFHLSAAWVGAGGAPAEGLAAPPMHTRRVCVFLDPEQLWPRRIEWWGDSPAGAGVLLQMEFRSPVLNQPLPDADCRREFTFTPH